MGTMVRQDRLFEMHQIHTTFYDSTLIQKE